MSQFTPSSDFRVDGARRKAAAGSFFRRPWLVVLSVALLLVSVMLHNPGTGSAEAPSDDYTMNDIFDFGTYGQVSVDSPGTGNIEEAGDRDFFILDLSSVGTYRLEISGSGDTGELENPRLFGVYKYAADLECSGAYDDPAVRAYAFVADATEANAYAVGVGAEGNGTGTYQITIASTDDTRTGCDTVQDSQDTAPGVPQDLAAEAASDTRIDLTWTAPDGEPTAYHVEWSADGESNWQGVDPGHSGAGTAYSHTGLTEETTYHYRVRAENEGGTGEWTEAVSAITQKRPNSPATGQPAISGTVQVEETLTADTSGIADDDGLHNTSFSYQWLADDVEIAGATDVTYTLVEADEGRTIKVRVSFTDDRGHEETLTSAATAAVTARPNSPATGAPAITGTAQVAETLTAATSGIEDEDGLTNATFTYQWLADDADISGATNSTYTLTFGENGKAIRVRVSFTDDRGHAESLTSAATTAVSAVAQQQVNSPPTGAPTITGTVEVGQTLTADASGIVDEDGLENATFSYQWLADDADISGATDSTYTIVDADEGKTVKVRVSFTDDAGNKESLTSAATGTVAARPNSPATGQPAITGTAQVAETLTVDTSGIADEDGLTNAVLNYQWTANDGSDDTDIEGATESTYTLTLSENGKTVKVRVSFADDRGHEESLTSEPTAAVSAAAQQQADTTIPTISSIAITSDPDDDFVVNGPYPWTGGWFSRSTGVYGIGDSIQVTVTFSEEVIVTGAPRLELSLGSNAGRFADYEGVDGNSLAFSYMVAEGDSATGGIAVAASMLTLNGGSVKDAAGNSANLSHVALAADSGHRVDGIRPTLLSLGVTESSHNSDDVYGPGEEVIIDADFSEPVFGSHSPAPQLKLDFDGVEKLATWETTGFGDFFSYYVQEGDSDLDGLEIAANSVVLNGGYFRDAAGNDATDLTHAAIAAGPYHKVDAVGPTISSMVITSDPGDDDTYGPGDKIEVTVTFSENVRVPGIYRGDMPGIRHPQLELTIGGEARTADYQNNQASAVVFAYNVRPGDTDEDGISIAADKLELNGGLIEDATSDSVFWRTLPT